jgi:hypothetical protein
MPHDAKRNVRKESSILKCLMESFLLLVVQRQQQHQHDDDEDGVMMDDFGAKDALVGAIVNTANMI